uniref:Uncharacterized protein n=1 Tax=Siphoviridae sp. ctUcA20 TaxID=2825528 RepID=A0A8S5PPJ1_9CAUD|nr:MAG TPA: hypothetical protein [Siphoviridae sp. ctUcA20]
MGCLQRQFAINNELSFIIWKTDFWGKILFQMGALAPFPAIAGKSFIVEYRALARYECNEG